MLPHLWNHEDSRGMELAAKMALTRASVGTWSTGAPATIEERGDWRAIVWFTVYLAASWSTTPTQPKVNSAGAFVVPGPPYATADAERKRAVAALLATLTHVYYPIAKSAKAPNDTGGPGMLYTRIRTVAGDPGYENLTAESYGDAAALPPAVWLGGVALICGVIIYLVEKGDEVIDRELARREETKRMLAYHAALANMMATHREAEVTAGKQLPLTSAEKAVLDSLEKAQSEQLAAMKADPGMSGVFPNIKGATGDIVKGTTSVTKTALVIAGLVAVVFFAMQAQRS